MTARHEQKYLQDVIIKTINSARGIKAAQPMNVNTPFRSRAAHAVMPKSAGSSPAINKNFSTRLPLFAANLTCVIEAAFLGIAAPFTKKFTSIAIGGRNLPAELVALALPE